MGGEGGASTMHTQRKKLGSCVTYPTVVSMDNIRNTLIQSSLSTVHVQDLHL